MIKKIAITQRVIENHSYSERRDALAHDWAHWLNGVFPDAAALAVPNRSDALDSWFEAVEPDAVILTGGNDWGEAPERDKLERRLVARSRNAGLPILGVCRGLQALNIILGGSVVTDMASVTEQEHIGQVHPVQLSGTFPSAFDIADRMDVNSYHGQCVVAAGVAPGLTVFAKAADGIVEGVFHDSEPIAAFQWHPERQSPSANFDEALVTQLFENGAFWTKASR